MISNIFGCINITILLKCVVYCHFTVSYAVSSRDFFRIFIQLHWQVHRQRSVVERFPVCIRAHNVLGVSCGMNLIGGVSTLNYLISRGDGVKLPNVCLFQEVSSEEYTGFVSLTSTC